MLRSEFLNEFLVVETENVDDLNLTKEEKNEYLELLNKFWVLNENDDDKEIVLEDFEADKGFVYMTLVNWNEVEFVKENGLGHSCFDYSVEDYCRDLNEAELGFNEDELTVMLYGEESNMI